MKLSQERTRTTLEYVLQNVTVENELGWMRKVITANGLSSSHPVFKANDNNVVDELASQRVEFRIVTNSEERLSKIAESMAISKK
jgi:outer membrane protein OmpA-like peptidoglycan-associated protein